MPAFEPVRAIQRGFAVLKIVSEQGPLTVAEIAKCSGLPQPTTVRIIETLLSDGFVFRVGGGLTYMVSSRTLALSRGYDRRSQLLSVASPHIDQLHIDIGWPSNLAILEGSSMVIIYTNRASLGLTMPARTGARLPLTVTGVGLTALAQMNAEDRNAVLTKAKVEENRWDADEAFRKDLSQKLDTIRRNGYAFAEEAYLDTIYQSRIWAVAVPIMGRDGRMIAGISSLVLRGAGDRQRLLRRILPKLKFAASQISEAF